MKEFLKNNTFNLLVLITLIVTICLVLLNIRLTCINFHSAQDYKISKGDYIAAIASYDEYLRINPLDSFAYFIRGKAYYYSENYNEALNDFLRYKNTGKTHESIYRYVGNSYAEIGKIEEALDTYTEGIKKHPQSSTLYNNRSYVKLLNNYDIQDALKDINMSLSFETFPEGYHTRAEIQRNIGLYEYAISDASKALEMAPYMYYNYCEKGYSQMKIGKTKDGINNLRTCKQFSEENNDYKYKDLYDEYLK